MQADWLRLGIGERQQFRAGRIDLPQVHRRVRYRKYIAQ